MTQWIERSDQRRLRESSLVMIAMTRRRRFTMQDTSTLHTLSYLWRMIRLESRKVGITRPIWLIEKTTDSGDIFSWDTNKAVTRSGDDWNTDDCDNCHWLMPSPPQWWIHSTAGLAISETFGLNVRDVIGLSFFLHLTKWVILALGVPVLQKLILSANYIQIEAKKIIPIQGSFHNREYSLPTLPNSNYACICSLPIFEPFLEEAPGLEAW